MLSWWFRTT